MNNKKETILYVDDEQKNLTVFKLTFRKKYNILLAQSAKEGIEIIKNNPVKLVISDQRMPEMTGVEFLKIISNDYPSIIRIIVTGFSDLEAVINAINKAGIYKYITKPWDIDEFNISIENALEAYNLRNENLLLLDNLVKTNTKLSFANKTLEQKVQERTKELRQKNNEIEASLRYAQTIQEAILPSDDEISNYFENFIIFRPKDIVSGDFYWLSSKSVKNKSYNFFAIIDCTGHGVPGALMSMIGNSILNEIVNVKHIYSPSEILNELDNSIKKLLKQDITDNKDGMDLGICRFEYKKNNVVLTFSGAKQKVFCIDGNNELQIYKSGRYSIGGVYSNYEHEKFSNEKITLNKGTIIYFTTDGLIDQNSPNRKRFGSKRFADTINEISALPLTEQKKIIEQKIDDWQQNEEQRDDITIIGLKI